MISVLWIGSLTFAALVNVSVFFVHVNEFDLPLSFYIIGLPCKQSSTGWIVNYIFQIAAVDLGTVLFLASLTTNLIKMNHCCWGNDILILLIEKLNSSLLNPDKYTEPSHIVKEHLKNIIEQSYVVFGFQKTLQDFLRISFFVDFTLLSIIFCLSIFKIVSDPLESLNILLIMIVAFAQLFINCVMGQRVVKGNDEFSASVYDIEWYATKATQRRDLQLILIKTQNMKSFDGIFNSVNMETLQKVKSD